MHFDVSTLTTAGRALLTRATAGSKIIWGTCGCFSQQTPGVSSTYLTGKVASGTAVAVFESTDSTSKITCTVENTESGLEAGSANSFGLWAKLDGDDEETLVLVAYVTSTPATYFPTYSGISSKVGAIIDIAITVSDGVVQTINIAESGYALAANLQEEIDARKLLELNMTNEIENLANRCVTTHFPSIANQGEAQDIYGVKTFKDTLIADSDILPKAEGNFNIGSLENFWSCLYTNKLQVCDEEENAPFSITCDYMAGEVTATCEDCDLNVNAETINVSGGNINANMNGDISLEATGSITLNGNSVKCVGQISATKFDGCIPVPTYTSGTTASIPKGAIVLCRVCYNEKSTAVSKVPGDTFIVGTPSSVFTVANWIYSNNAWSAGQYLTSGTYTCLSAFTAVGSGVAICLVMRTA